jgi:hypothetical protein
MTGWRLISSIPAMMRSLSSCLDATRIWRRTERANLEKKPARSGDWEGEHAHVHNVVSGRQSVELARAIAV